MGVAPRFTRSGAPLYESPGPPARSIPPLSLVNGNLDTGFQNSFGFGQVHLIIIHIRESQLLHRPTSGKEIVLGKERIFVDRHTDVAHATAQPFGPQRLGKLFSGAFERLGVHAQHIKPAGPTILGVGGMGENAGHVGNQLV